MVGVAGSVDTLPKFEAGESLRTIPVRACLLLLLLERSRTWERERCYGNVISSRVKGEICSNFLCSTHRFRRRNFIFSAHTKDSGQWQAENKETANWSDDIAVFRADFLFSVKSFWG